MDETSVLPPAAPDAAGHPLTYFSVQSSSEFQNAKKMLADNDLDACLASIETLLRSTSSLVSNDELHESLAPLYYLYGSTLLYVVEDSNDSTSMMDGAAASSAADEMEVAWMNLESARTIIERLLRPPNALVPEQLSSLTLDLAQIHCRLGDLTKHDGNFLSSAQDYEACLALRKRVLGAYHRKVADCHMSLATVTLQLATTPAAGPKDDGGGSDSDGEDAGRDDAEDEVDAATTLTDEERERLSRQSVRHYVDCAKCFAGMNALSCDKDPAFPGVLGSPGGALAASAGDDDDDDDDDDAKTPVRQAPTYPDTPAAIVKALRKACTALPLFKVLPVKPLSSNPEDPLVVAWQAAKDEAMAQWTEEEDDFMFNLETIDELLENIEASEDNIKVLMGVADSKAKLEASDGSAAGADGTTVGFGAQPLAVGVTVTEGFGNVAPAFPAAADDNQNRAPNAEGAVPVMLVKSKKRAAVLANVSNQPMEGGGGGGAGRGEGG